MALSAKKVPDPCSRKLEICLWDIESSSPGHCEILFRTLEVYLQDIVRPSWGHWRVVSWILEHLLSINQKCILKYYQLSFRSFVFIHPDQTLQHERYWEGGHEQEILESYLPEVCLEQLSWLVPQLQALWPQKKMVSSTLINPIPFSRPLSL